MDLTLDCDVRISSEPNDSLSAFPVAEKCVGINVI